MGIVEKDQGQLDNKDYKDGRGCKFSDKEILQLLQ
jgi:hypothetical protein